MTVLEKFEQLVAQQRKERKEFLLGHLMRLKLQLTPPQINLLSRMYVDLQKLDEPTMLRAIEQCERTVVKNKKKVD